VEGHRALTNLLKEQEIDPIVTSSLRECLDLLATRSVRLVFCESTLADGNYRDLLNAVRAEKLRTRIVVTSRGADWGDYLEATRLGAFDVIVSPCRPTDVDWMIIRAHHEEIVRAEKSLAAHHGATRFREASAGEAF
jgi:DNA-binding NtrC family response regulator